MAAGGGSDRRGARAVGPATGGHPVTTHIAADLPFVPMDDLLVQQVLVNLLENAARHTPPGTPIEVTASVGRSVDRGRGGRSRAGASAG